MWAGRIRRIHPDFWSDSRVNALSDVEALGYIALWSRIVDDCGRSVYSPSEFHMMVRRFSESQWGKFVTKYIDMGMVMMYEEMGQRYIYVPRFVKLQRVNRPTPSLCPVPPAEGEGIIPSKEKEPKDDIPYETIVTLWNEICGQWCPNVSYDRLGDRRAMIRRVWEKGKRHRDLEWWRDYFMKVSRSDFLTNRNQRNSTFRAPFQWVLLPRNMQKILDGNYDNRDRKEKLMKEKNKQALDEFIEKGREEQNADDTKEIT